MTIFEKIINGDIPAHKVYEDDHTIAFLDIHPSMPGHTLVVPKNPVEFVWDLPMEDYQTLMNSVNKVARRLREVLPQKYINMSVVGNEVPHAHIHLVPFDTSADLYKPERDSIDPNHEALSKMAEKLSFS